MHMGGTKFREHETLNEIEFWVSRVYSNASKVILHMWTVCRNADRVHEREKIIKFGCQVEVVLYKMHITYRFAVYRMYGKQHCSRETRQLRQKHWTHPRKYIICAIIIHICFVLLSYSILFYFHCKNFCKPDSLQLQQQTFSLHYNSVIYELHFVSLHSCHAMQNYNFPMHKKSLIIMIVCLSLTY